MQKGGRALGRKVAISIQDSAGKNEQAVAAYRRLVTNEKAVAVFGFIHSGANIAVNEVAKEMGIPTMGDQYPLERHGQTLRHRVPHPRGRPAA